MVQMRDIYYFLNRVEPVLMSELTPSSDLHDDLGITGSDFSIVMHKFEREFNVDMRNYRWYFHHTEDNALGLAGLFKNSPSFRVPYIPVTPHLLLDAVNQGKWPVDYPEHDLSGVRFDITVDRIIGLALFLFIVTWIITETGW